MSRSRDLADIIEASQDIKITGGDILTTATTASVFDTVATTLNVGQAATTISIGATTGTTTIRNNVSVTGDVAINGGDITTTATTASVFDTTATTANIARAGTSVVIGATTGNTNIRNNIQQNGTTIVDTNRRLMNFRLDTVAISTNTTAVTGDYYVATASLTLTLPATPTVGDVVGFSNQSGTTTCIIARNGSNIKGLAEDMTVDSLHAAFALQYVNATAGWVFV